jgi:hypothetical protein
MLIKKTKHRLIIKMIKMRVVHKINPLNLIKQWPYSNYVLIMD